MPITVRGFLANEAGGLVMGGECGGEGGLDGGSPLLGEERVVAAEVGNIGGDTEEKGWRVESEWGGVEGGGGVEGDEVGGVEDVGGDCEGGSYWSGVPFGDEAVGGDTGVKVVGAGAVHVGDVAGGGGLEAGEVEMGISGLEGVEGPGDEGEASLEGKLALGVFELGTEALSLKGGDDAGELGVEADAGADLGEKGEGEAGGLAVGQEGAEDEPAVELSANHRGDGDDVAVLMDAPSEALGVLAGLVVGDGLAGSDEDRGPWHGRGLRGMWIGENGDCGVCEG